MRERWQVDRTGDAALDELRHEVRNALTTVKGYTQWALRYLPADADARLVRALKAAQEGVDRACQLLRRDWGTRALAECDLGELVRCAASQLPPERCEDLTVHLLTAGPLIGYWDRERVTQIVANLLDNAAKYSAPGSPIEVELARVLDQGKAWALIAVRDQGIGLAPEDLTRVFEGQRTAPARQQAPGAGLGLPLSRRLAAAEGGHLWAFGSPGKGSVFYLLLPLPESGAPPC